MEMSYVPTQFYQNLSKDWEDVSRRWSKVK